MKAMEYIWLLLGFFSLLGSVHAFTQHDLKNAGIFLLMLFISALMFTLRMKLRKKNEREEQKEKES